MCYCLQDFSKKMAGREFIDMSFKAFDASRKSPNGISVVRLRKGQFAKKLVEEILPVSAFLGYFERQDWNYTVSSIREIRNMTQEYTVKDGLWKTIT